MHSRLSSAFVSLVVILASGHRCAAADAHAIDFNRDIRPILSKNCFSCHGLDEGHRSAGLRLDERAGAMVELDSGERAIVPGHADRSELLARVATDDDSIKMPPEETGNALSVQQIDLLRRWIEQGAPYAKHWSFAVPKKRRLPKVIRKDWPQNEVDHFILARLEREGLSPAPQADRPTLIRRLSLDLRGLPPTPEEVDVFVNDRRPGAYERLVDRFLNDPAYGERWARMWLDLARYADSKGYGSDPLREIWRYRDWVIDAFNANKPFDEFTIEQLAGDLLPKPSLDQLMATAFHRNTMTNTEGGTDDEEFRVEAVRDRVDTTIQVWMGLTMGCAKCHTHKYDPVTQTEYYRFYAFFNQTEDNDRPDEAPTIPAPTDAIREANRAIDREVAELRHQLDQPTAELAVLQQTWEEKLRSRATWTPLTPQTFRAQSGAALERLDDGSLLAKGKIPATETYTVEGVRNLHGITAIRLEAIPDPSLPRGGAGRGADGNFVLSSLGVATADPAVAGQPVEGRYLRVELPGNDRLLSLAEVQVFGDGTNLARFGKATQSSTDFSGPAEWAIDGRTNGDYTKGRSTTHTAKEDDPWWEVDLGRAEAIDSVTLWNRTDNNNQDRLRGCRVSILDERRQPVWQRTVTEPPNPKVDLVISGKQPVELKKGVASFAQSGFSVMDVIKPKSLTQNGWAVAPHQQKAQTAIFLPTKPFGDGKDSVLSVRLDHRFKDPGYALGRFRLSVTNDPAVNEWLSVPADVLALVDTPLEDRTDEQSRRVDRYFRTITPALQPVRDRIAALEKSRPKAPTLPIMKALPSDRQRETYVMVKGNFLTKGATVSPAVPAAFHAMETSAPTNRLGVARWLVSPRNPLTARVNANRIWSQLMGIGIVETEEDFGSQGELPSHPELLDWLAVDLVENDWDLKQLLRTIVTSATYRQASTTTPEKLKRDPRNRLLARGARYRLAAETVRDQALALSGLLSTKMRGASVFPPQPPGLWRAAFNGRDRKWATSGDEDRFRRGLYTFWRRSVPYPSMATFDAPSREVCAVRRIRTNTPLQAFVTLNDPVYIEAAQALARRLVREGGATPEERIRYGLRLCLTRPPEQSQVDTLLTLLASEQSHYKAHPDEAKTMATEPLGPLPEGTAPEEMAAWTVVANVLLNLDAVLTRG
ncbi:Planctomycete cytochrome C [Planctomycetes bacterium Pan216]|uniref:Planctomycete cytochrome C n=1 Tax=Kolteria novifilia TaxID=2527975 RepID=A0A518B8U3_9BACT|nr:Planctomycete cytochrome C [Planctomycetes bacterium Pan216]